MAKLRLNNTKLTKSVGTASYSSSYVLGNSYDLVPPSNPKIVDFNSQYVVYVSGYTLYVTNLSDLSTYTVSAPAGATSSWGSWISLNENNYLGVTDQFDGSAGTYAGSTHLYQLGPTSATYLYEFVDVERTSATAFPYVGVTEDNYVVHPDPYTPTGGTVYFTTVASTAIVGQRNNPDNNTTYPQFGNNMDVVGNRVFVGANNTPNGLPKVHVFEPSISFAPQQSLVLPGIPEGSMRAAENYFLFHYRQSGYDINVYDSNMGFIRTLYNPGSFLNKKNYDISDQYVAISHNGNAWIYDTVSGSTVKEISGISTNNTVRVKGSKVLVDNKLYY